MKCCQITIAMLLLATVGACGPRYEDISQNPESAGLLELLLPQEVQIVEAFTEFKSFDDDRIPDGLEVLLQPTNAFGETVNIVGGLRFELYSYQQASGIPAGKRYQQWDVVLASKDDHQRYWNKATQMYEFQLLFDVETIPREEKYVVQVTYNSPLKKHLTGQAVVDAPTPPGAMLSQR
jgi:hypothetical protein